MTDEQLTEHYQSIKSILLSNNFSIESCKPISFGLQFSISRDNKCGLIRLYQRKNGKFTLDYTLLKDKELLHSVKQLLETTHAPAGSPEKIPVPPGTSGSVYDVGYPVIGSDESGKGDYFGPLVCAAVCVDETTAGELCAAGVRDSKTCSDREIRELAETIKQLCAGKFEIIEISPEKYNKLYEQMRTEGKNLNTLLAWGHAKAIEELLQKVDCGTAIADQFADKRFILGKLQQKGRTIRLIQMHRQSRTSLLRQPRSWPGPGSSKRLHHCQRSTRGRFPSGHRLRSSGPENNSWKRTVSPVSRSWQRCISGQQMRSEKKSIEVAFVTGTTGLPLSCVCQSGARSFL